MSAWTTERPTTAGWYWWRFNENRNPTAIYLSSDHVDGRDVFTVGTIVLLLHEVPGEWQPVIGPRE
jgi:hypothetical protein